MWTTITPERPGPFSARRRAPGAAMVEFILFLPFLILVLGVSVYLAMGLAVKEDLVVKTRYQVWRDAADTYMMPTWFWHDDMNDQTWSAYDPNASGPPGSGAAGGNQPRGTGDALTYLFSTAGQQADSATSNPGAQDLFNRVWNNLPGRYDVKNSILFTTSGSGFDKFFNGTIYAELQNDTADWTHGQLPLWVIAQYGPMQQINAIFHQNLNAVAPANGPFYRMGQEVLHAWFNENYMPPPNPSSTTLPAWTDLTAQ